MLVFIDESGDPGFKVDKGSTLVFAVAMVIITDGAAASQIGPDAQASVVLLNKILGLSHIKLAAAFRALFGIALTRGASAQIVLRAADRLGPAYREVRQEIKSTPCLTPDETGWRVAGRPAWLHAWVTERATGYAIDPHRKADVLERLIGIDWSGRMVHDGFAWTSGSPSSAIPRSSRPTGRSSERSGRRW